MRCSEEDPTRRDRRPQRRDDREAVAREALYVALRRWDDDRDPRSLVALAPFARHLARLDRELLEALDPGRTHDDALSVLRTAGRGDLADRALELEISHGAGGSSPARFRELLEKLAVERAGERMRDLADRIADGEALTLDGIARELDLAADRDAAAPRYALVALADWVDRRPPYLVDETIPCGALVVLYGPSGAGKTYVALSLACAVAAGRPWLDRFAVAAGPAVYLYGEGGGTLRARVAAWQRYHRVADVDIALWALSETPALADTRNVDALAASIRAACTPALIVVDTLTTSFGAGNQDTAQDTAAYVAGVRALQDALSGPAVVLLHHEGRGHEDLRGSTALRDAADVVLRLDRPGHKDRALAGAPDEPLTFAHLLCRKARDAEPFPARTIAFRATDGQRVADLAGDGEAPAEPARRSRETREDLAARIVEHLAANPLASTTSVREAVRRRKDDVVAILETMHRAGRVAMAPGAQNAKHWSLVRDAGEEHDDGP